MRPLPNPCTLNQQVGAAAIRQSGRSTRFTRELEAMGLAADEEGSTRSSGLYSFVRPKE